MNKQQCPNGHYYDSDVYSECPHCSDTHTANVTSGFVVKPNQIILDVNNGIVRSCTDQGLSVTLSKFAEIRPSASAPKQDTPADNAPVIQPAKTVITENPKITPAADPVSAKVAPIPAEQTAQEEIAPAEPQYSQYNDRSYEEVINPIAGWLVCIGGKYYGRAFNVYFGQNSIGRDAANMISLPYEEEIAEKNHLMVTYEPIKNRFYIIPGRNTGMTYLNGEYLAEAKRLSDRDIISVGSEECNLMFVALCDEKFNWAQNAN